MFHDILIKNDHGSSRSTLGIRFSTFLVLLAARAKSSTFLAFWDPPGPDRRVFSRFGARPAFGGVLGDPPGITQEELLKILCVKNRVCLGKFWELILP